LCRCCWPAIGSYPAAVANKSQEDVLEGRLLLDVFDLGRRKQLLEFGERAVHAAGGRTLACEGVLRGLAHGQPAPVVRGPSIADGIRIPEPTRAERSYAAVRYSGGRWISVSEEAIERTWRAMAARGVLMEPTSAAALAGARALNLPAGAVVIITGSGLKAVDRY